MTKKEIKEISDIVKKLLNLLELKGEVETEEKENGEVFVQIETDEPGLLIGYHGQGIAALQQIVNLIIYRQTENWPKIIVNVGDYWERRKTTLEQLAKAVAQKVKFSHEEQFLPPMTPGERKIVHLCLAEDSEVETVSEGEGRDRRVVIRPKEGKNQEKAH